MDTKRARYLGKRDSFIRNAASNQLKIRNKPVAFLAMCTSIQKYASAYVKYASAQITFFPEKWPIMNSRSIFWTGSYEKRETFMGSEFLQSVRENMRLRGYSLSTEKTYILWIRRFIQFSNDEHPRTVSFEKIGEYLTYLACERHVSVNTQKTALNALVYLFEKFLKRKVGDLGFKLAVKQRQLPTVPSKPNVTEILAQLSGRNSVIIGLLYGSGLRVTECLRLRVQDVNLDDLSLTVHDGKGRKDRNTILGKKSVPGLKLQISEAIKLQQKDKLRGVGSSMSPALTRKYPSAPYSPAWAYLFPSSKWCAHPLTGEVCRHHLHVTMVRRFLKVAVAKAGILNHRVSCHTFRHSFATQMLLSGTNIRKLQEMLGHNDAATTEIYIHVIGEHFAGSISPLDQLD